MFQNFQHFCSVGPTCPPGFEWVIGGARRTCLKVGEPIGGDPKHADYLTGKIVKN